MANLIPVAVGAGHSHNGYDSGAIGIGGVKEADLTFEVANHLNDMLKKDGRFNVLLVDPLTPLADRPKLVNQFGALLYTEIHFNAVDNPSAKGTEALDYNGTGVGYAFSKAFTDIMAQREGLVNRGVKDTGKTFCIIRETTHDAVIPEVGFITNTDDYSHFDTPEELKEIAYYCYLAFCSAFNLQPRAEVDPNFNSLTDATAKAINVLVQNKVINTPDYWMQNAKAGKQVNGEYAGYLIQKMAEILGGR